MGLVAGSVFAADPGKGGQLYGINCVTCHGEDGRGTMPGVPDFTRGEGLFQPNHVLAKSIREGKTIMPAFRGILTNNEIDDVIAYLRTFH